MVGSFGLRGQVLGVKVDGALGFVIGCFFVIVG